MTPEIKAKELTQLLEGLINILEQEILILAEPRTITLSPIVQEKQLLLAEYETFMQEISLTPSFFHGLDEEIKTNLKTLNERFQNAALENEKRLSIATRSSQLVADRIKDAAVKASGTKVRSYGQSGGYTNTGTQRTTPIAINQTL